MRIIATSRPSAIKEGWLSSDGFSECEILTMGQPEISQCIDHWHAAVREGLSTPIDLAELEACKDRLRKEISEQAALRGLATIPLLCAMLCALNRKRNRHLPRDRVELYEAACNMLVDRRDRERAVDLSDYPDLSYRQKMALLQDIAYWMLKNGQSEMEVAAVDYRIGERLPNMLGVDTRFTASAVRKYLVDRTGLLREPSTGQIDFAHRTFLEYLAAKQVIVENDINLMLQHSGNDNWREVIVLAVGLLENVESRNLVFRSLLDKGERNKAARHQPFLLAIACLESATELDHVITAEVVDNLSVLIPPRSIGDAKDLASAGQLAIPFLGYDSEYKALQAAACARALALIGGEAAFVKLAEYAEDRRATVVNELLKAWAYFDQVEFAEKILSKIVSEVQSITFSRRESVAGIRFMKWVTSLTIERPYGSVDVSEIAELPKLASLRILEAAQVHGLELLSGIQSLKLLQLSSVQIVPSHSLASMEWLETLSVSYSLFSDPVPSFLHLKNLTNLTLFGNMELVAVPKLPTNNLRRLDMRRSIGLESIDEIAMCPEIQVLRLSYCVKLRDLSAVGAMRKVTHLELAGLHGEAVETLKLDPTVQLTRLVIDANSLARVHKLSDMRPIGTLVVQTLSRDTDLAILNDAPQHTSLMVDLWESSLRPLTTIASLQALEIRSARAKASGLGFLSKIKGLRHLTLRGNFDASEIANLYRLDTIEELDLKDCWPLQTDLKQFFGKLRRLKSIRVNEIVWAHIQNLGLNSALKNVRV